jgi:hypothetical protein
MKKIVMLIITCEKYKHRADLQRSTWLRSIPSNIEYFHVIGNKNFCGTSDYRFDHENHMLYTSTKDDYLSLPDKVITAIYAAKNELEFDFIYKVDDDEVLINSGFFDTLEPILYQYDYGGHMVDIEGHHSNFYQLHSEVPSDLYLEKARYCGGPFYFLSRKAVRYLLEKKLFLSTKIIEDHAIGRILSMDHNDISIFQMVDLLKQSFVNYDDHVRS